MNYLKRVDHSGGTRIYPEGWDGLHEFVKWDWGWLQTRMRVSAELLRQGLACIDYYRPFEAKRMFRDTDPAGAV